MRKTGMGKNIVYCDYIKIYAVTPHCIRTQTASVCMDAVMNDLCT